MMQQVLAGDTRSCAGVNTRWLSDPWVWSAVLAALVVRLARLGAAPMWFDEAVTAQWIALPWGEMVRTVLADYHPPLYFLVLKGWSELVGSSPWALRFPSAVLSWLTVPLVAAVAGTLVSRSAGRWGAWLAACSPFLLHHGQETRMYPLVAVLAAANLLLLARFATGAVRSLDWNFVVVASALIASHYYGLFFVGGALLAVLILRPGSTRSWLPAATATSAVMLIALLAAMVLPSHHPVSEYQLGWLAFPGVVWSMLTGYTLLPSSEDLHALGWHAVVPYLPIAAAGVSALAVVFLAGARSMRRTAVITTLVPFAAALAGPFVVRLVMAGSLNPRYFAAAMPAFLVYIAAGIAACVKSSIGRGATALLIAVMLAGSARQLMDPSFGREDVRAAAEWLDANVPPGETLLVSSGEMAMLARFHWPTRPMAIYPEPNVVVTRENVDAVADRLPFPGPQRAVYVFGRAWLSDPAGTLQQSLSERYSSCGGTLVRGIHILCLVRPEMGDQRQAAAQPMRGPAMAPQADGGTVR